VSERTCSMRGCKTKASARGLCNIHYQRARNAGTLPPLQLAIPLAPIHSLSNVDQTTARGDCAICGHGVPVRIRRGRGAECGRKPRKSKNVTWVEDPERKRIRAREYRLSARFGITLEEYDAMLQTQGGVCAVCGGIEEGRRLAVDHCHESGVVRALLCTSCNWQLGVYEIFREKAQAFLATYGRGNPILRQVAPPDA
jgi:hypothetical protein